MRYEVAVETTLAFHTQRPPYPGGVLIWRVPETVVIGFEGRRFVWHTLPPDDDGRERWPTVTTVIDSADNYDVERLAMERFLSALAYVTRQSIEVVNAGGAGVPAEMDPPVATALRRGLGDYMEEAPEGVDMADDDRLRKVLGYYREGLGTSSPFFKFLAFWNALDVACDDRADGMKGWIPATLAKFPYLRGDEPAPSDWWDYLFMERRSAVAHAVRDHRGPELDPDDPDAHGRFWRDARMLEDLVRMRVQERWGDYPVYRRRRRD
jgi:hypothetical protein